MKRVFLTSIFVSVLLSLIIFQSCDSNSFTNEEKLTEADLLVRSPEFQRFQAEGENSKEESLEMLSRISSEEWIEIEKIMNKILKSDDHEYIFCLADSLQLLSGIDYVGRAEKMIDLSSGVFVEKNFSSRDFIKALEKNRINNVTIPRVKSSSENDKAKLEGCVQGCEFSYEEYVASCDKGLHNHPRPEDHVVCQVKAGINRDKCIADCEKKYGKK